jgi:hypothetical protein
MERVAASTSWEVVQYGLYFLISLPVGWLAWKMLQRLAGAFERKRFSDVQLIIDCWWFIVSADAATTLSTTLGFGGVAGCMAAFLAYRVTVALALRGAAAGGHERPARLLLLRVFGYQRRTELLFDRIAQQWRFHGPVQLIAGLDLSTRTTDPGDILAFVGGRLADQYVATPTAVPLRLSRLDLKRDPDGRYRVNEVYCHDDTWRPTLQALLDASDVVLMDLRSFSERNAGCIFELQQLVDRVPTDRLVFVSDRTTDLNLLGRVLNDAWTASRRTGHARGDPHVTVMQVERHSRHELSELMRRLRDICSPGGIALAGSGV